MTKLYISFLQDDNKILSITNGFYHSDIHKVIPDNSFEITEQIHQEYLDILNNQQKLLWIDADNNIQIRDRLSKWDKKKKTFVTDQDAIDAENKLIMKDHAKLLIDKYIKNTISYYFNKYNKQEQDQLNNYLDALHEENMIELPIKPDFLG